jgi:hypothetical protein
MWPFGKFSCHLVYFSQHCQEKSGNLLKTIRRTFYFYWPHLSREKNITMKLVPITRVGKKGEKMCATLDSGKWQTYRDARFVLAQYTKPGKNVPKDDRKIRNGQKTYQMAMIGIF